jgi:hypothetical protein
VEKFFLSFAKYDIWSLLSFVILVAGSVLGYLKFYRPRKHIKYVNIDFKCQRAPGWLSEFRILIIFSNNTGKSIFITSALFKFKDLRPDEKSIGDKSTNLVPAKFPINRIIAGEEQEVLDAFECYLKNDEITHTYIPIDPKHTDEEVIQAFKNAKAGTFSCYISILSRDKKPVIYRLKIKPKGQFSIQTLEEDNKSHPLTFMSTAL